ncbi:leucine-rich repeat-containing protein 27 isoform X1 [Rhineura floridana]|uniref:leucine-rich repeat-containing protein 27 isoform X1 n=1 Tax=Rhineura floridana TaxID=261503 RepID=UPI002AC80C7A|nr:leucine-rich repeat-containing protein 27 isoform X1 [Rhineura floridana]XP_061491619.1 leucine-rich repeat-containing protein 27 isoform X1 [Rhineura floridana]
MEEKCPPSETDGAGGDAQNAQNKRRTDSASSSSRCIRLALENLVSNSSVSLDLSRKDLQHLTEDIYKLFNLKHLHLEGNALSVVPEDFFQRVPNLVWLDLRYNKIKELPPGIGCHKQLKTLLLERNPIKRLPVELGNIASLTALNLRHCPLEFPPLEVIQKGLPVILSFLRRMSDQNIDYSEPVSPEMPPVEKLNLTDFMKSSLDLSDGWPNEEEIVRFQKLRDELIQDEREEYLANKMVPNDSMPSLRRTKTKESISRKSSIISSRGKKNLFPAVSSYDVIIQSKRAEQCRLAALKEMKEKQALIEQRKKDKEVLQKWRKQAKMIKEKKDILYTFSPDKGDMVSKNAPYATDDFKYHDKLEGWKEPNKHDEHMEMTLNSMKMIDELRAAKYKEVENRIKQHTQVMKERKKKLTGIPQEDMERAKQDFETAENLEEELADLRKDLHQEYRFTAFTGELPPPAENPLPTPKPQNIFSNMTF